MAAAEQEADKQLMDAAMRKDAQDQAADKQLKAERKAEQLNYRSPSMLCFPSQNVHRENSLAESVVVLVSHDVYMQARLMFMLCTLSCTGVVALQALKCWCTAAGASPSC